MLQSLVYPLEETREVSFKISKPGSTDPDEEIPVATDSNATVATGSNATSSNWKQKSSSKSAENTPDVDESAEIPEEEEFDSDFKEIKAVIRDEDVLMYEKEEEESGIFSIDTSSKEKFSDTRGLEDTQAEKIIKTKVDDPLEEIYPDVGHTATELIEVELEGETGEIVEEKFEELDESEK